MMKHAILTALLLLAGARYGFAADPPPCTFSNVDPTPGPLQTLINDAGTLSGSVICLDAGSKTYTVTVDPTAGGTKCTEIRGAGTMPAPWGSAGETIVYTNNPGGAAFYGRTKAGCRSTISNIRFTFDENAATPYSLVGFNDSGPDGTTGLPPIYHHNDFFITGQCQQPIIIDAATKGGLIYRNKFTAEAIAGGGCNYSSTNMIPVRHETPNNDAEWAKPSTYGSLDTDGLSNMYVETNYFKNFAVAADLTSSSRGVWRFNEMHNAATGGHGYDSNAQGDRQEEQYNNEHYCDDTYNIHAYLSQRGATWRIFNNNYRAWDVSKCHITDGSTTATPISFSQYRLIQCDAGNIGGWPGSYPATYPVGHQVGWGYKTGATNVGSSTAQGIPGGSGFDQDLDPIYTFANTNSTGNDLLAIASGYVGECRAMAYSNTGKSSGTTLVIPSGSAQATPYVNVGQEALVVFSDLVAGTAPTIADSLGNSWTACTGGTNGSLRLSCWHSHITTGGAIVVTITFQSSAAARSGTLVVMRGMTATPLDQNPAVNTSANATPYLGPTVGGVGGAALAQTNEIVLGYYALQGPTDKTGNSTVVNDAIDATSPSPTTDNRAASCAACTGMYNLGIIGTTGSTDTTNATVAVIQRWVTATTAVQPSLTNSTANRNGIAGTITFKVTGNDNNNLSLQSTDFIQSDREYFTQASGINTSCPTGSTCTPFNGTTGTGWGPRSLRPTTCTFNSMTGVGVGYWSTDQGSWNMSGSGGQGVLDLCTATNTWTNDVYHPYDYPNPLATVTGGSSSPSITSLTPAVGVQAATSLSIAVVGSSTNFVNATTVCDFGASITVNSCTVSSATTLTASITISAGAAIGARDATFTTGGEVVTSSGGFTVSSGGLFIKKVAPRKFRKL